MSEFYDEMYEVGQELLSEEEFGVAFDLTDQYGTVIGTGLVVYVNPTDQNKKTDLQPSYLAESNHKIALFQMDDQAVIPEDGFIINSSGRARTISDLENIAPADQLVLYKCLLEV